MRITDALQHYPDITRMEVTLKKGMDKELAAILKGVLTLPHLESFQCGDGDWNTEAVEILAKHPSVKHLYFNAKNKRRRAF